MKYRYILIGSVIILFLFVVSVSYNDFITNSYAGYTRMPIPTIEPELPWYHGKVFDLYYLNNPLPDGRYEFTSVIVLYVDESWVKIKLISSSKIVYIPIHSIARLEVKGDTQ